VKKGADAGDGFGQGDRGAAMEIAEWLVEARRDRHRRDHSHGRELTQLDAQCLIETGLLGQLMYVHELPFDTPACTEQDCKMVPGSSGVGPLNRRTGV
jgi:hypothetical protein